VVSSRDDNFFELGGSSLRAAELLVAVHGKFGKRFTFATVVSEPTIAAMARLIDGKREGGGAAVTRHIVALNTRGELPPFFGMHPLFGLVYPYAELARLLAPQQPFYALQARGFQRGERPHASMQELAADYCTAIRGVQPHGPYFIGGWSLGSLIALEVAQQLQQAGESVACLAIIDQATDSMERFLDQTPLRTRLGRFGQVLDNAMRSYDPCFARHRGVLGAVRAPIRFLRFLNAVFVPMLKVGWACNKIARDYVIKPYAGRISLLHTDDPELTHIEDQRWGWEQVARDGVDVYRISGDHFNLHEYPHVGQLASQLREALESCRGPHGARGAVHPG
jgi:thioesterase domain-containing protein